jgi:hypothetical protein
LGLGKVVGSCRHTQAVLGKSQTQPSTLLFLLPCKVLVQGQGHVFERATGWTVSHELRAWLKVGLCPCRLYDSKNRSYRRRHLFCNELGAASAMIKIYDLVRSVAWKAPVF